MAAHVPATALPSHVLNREDVQAAIAQHDFGRVFALARKWAGISFSKIAESCDIKPERVGSLARGSGRITSYEKIACIADAMRIPGHMLGLAPRMWEMTPVVFPVAESVFASQLEGGDDVLRREFLKISVAGAGMSVLSSPTLGLMSAGRRVGNSVPDYLRLRAARLRRLDDVLGGGDTYVIYRAEYDATRSIIRDGTFSTDVGRNLLSVLAEQAQQAGWAAFDSGNHGTAIRLYQASMKAAEEAGDKALQGNAFAFLAYQRLSDDPNAALALADASCEAASSASLSGSVGALLHERRAWAYAVAGNASESEKALDQAHAALVADRDAPQPDWSSWVDATELKIMSGRCWTELRRPLRAVPILRDVLAGFDDSHARDKSLYLSWLADSYLTAGEIEESASVANRILDLSAGIASVRPRQQLSGVLNRLSDHRDIPIVNHVLEKARG